MKKTILFLAIFFMFLTACVVQQQQPAKETEEQITTEGETAPEEEIDVEAVQQDENVVEIIEEEPQEELSAERKYFLEFVNKAPTAYVFKQDPGGARYVTVSGNKRSIGEYRTDYDNIYWGTDTKEVLLYTREIPESWWCQRKNLTCGINQSLGAGKYLPAFFKFIVSGDKEQDESLVPDELQKWFWVFTAAHGSKIVKTDWFGEVYTFGPIDWLMAYKDAEPVKIDHKKITVKVLGKEVTVDTSIYFQDDDGKTVIFRMDPKLNVPMVVEKLNSNGTQVEYYKYLLETQYRRNTFESVPIQDVVTPPSNHIIVTVSDMNAYDEYKEGSRENAERY